MSARATRAARGAALLGVAFAVACVAPRSPGPTARVSVRVERGMDTATASGGALLQAPTPVHVVLDPGASPAGPGAALARAAAARYLEALPASVPAEVRVVGLGPSDESGCGLSAPLARTPRAGMDLAPEVAGLPPGAPGSLGEALGVLATELDARVAAGAAPGARVVVFGDFTSPCPPSPCEAGAALTATGAELALVALGDAAEPPACLVDLAPAAGPPPGLAVAPPPAAARFRVERRVTRPGRGIAGARSEGETGIETVAEGTSGEDPVAVVPGAARVVVELGGEPLVVGPLVLADGVETRIRILEFPAADERRVWVDAVAPAVRAPPPDAGWDE